MASCMLVFEDVDDGEVVASIAFEPPLPEGRARPFLTNAQQVGMRILEASFAVFTDIQEEEK